MRVKDIEYVILFFVELRLVAAGVESFTVWLREKGLVAWTVCPVCGADDFTHIEDCRLDKFLEVLVDG